MRGILAAALGVITATVGTVPAQAASPAAGLDWKPYRSQPYTVAAGERCAFAVHAEPVVDEERIATLSSYPDGKPRQQVITGDLRVRYTNLDTGVTVEHDLDGTAFIEYGTDGSMTHRYLGAVAVGFRATDAYPKGIWRLDGYHEVRFGPGGGMREIRVDGGTEHNVCTDLA
ncbi:hypothetical protein [Micromonospora sp. KC721]|uniref:hypothetical protein n=1 Tax=Micromonospora sp. KC721 TaxID=2530380 RepID=UPI001045794F|nr:hypothetical protein [Micromonospora sp. KC721]TDB70912.1 hypothetical protein E1182_26270 [Micromonospora sp. KC721]